MGCSSNTSILSFACQYSIHGSRYQKTVRPCAVIIQHTGELVSDREVLFLLLGFTIGSLLAILCLLTGRATTVSTRYVCCLLGLGLHLVVVILLRTTTVFEDHTAHDNIANVADTLICNVKCLMLNVNLFGCILGVMPNLTFNT